MRKIITLFACAFLSISTMALQGQSFAPVADSLVIQFTKKIKSSRPRNLPEAVVHHDVHNKQGALWIKANTPVTMSTEKQRSRTKGREGTIRIKFLSTTDVDGKTVMLSGSHFKAGKSRRGVAYGLSFGLGFIPLPGIGFLFLTIPGRNAAIHEGTLVKAGYTHP